MREIVITADKIRKRRKFGSILKMSILLLIAFLIIAFLVLKVVYHDSNFVVTLNSKESLESGLAIYESLYDRKPKRILKAQEINFMNNISEKWLPEDIDDEHTGSHNGNNFIAYTFYVENQSSKDFNYWYRIIVEDVVKNVDEAIRIRIYLNGKETTYAKGSSIDGGAESGTKKFRNDSDGTILMENRPSIKPNEIDRITIVVWIEGDDPECIDSLLGGEISMKMEITDEHTN